MRKLLFWIFVFSLFSSIVLAGIDDYTDTAYYKFNDNLDDETGNFELAGTIRGYVTGVTNCNNAADFEKDNNDVVENLSFSGAPDIRTIDMWLKPETQTHDNAFFGSFTVGSQVNSLWCHDEQNKIQCVLYLSSVAKWTLDSTTAMVDGVLIHLIIVMGSGGAKMYINGAITPEDTSADTSVLGDWSTIKIGHSAVGNTWDGTIDNVRLTNTAYSTADVTTSYNSGNCFEFNIPSLLFDLTAEDIYDGSAINTFNASIFNSTFTETLNTVNGTITFSQSSGNFSLKINASNYFRDEIQNVNISVDLSAKLIQGRLRLNASEVGTFTAINIFNVSVPLQSNATTNGTAILYLKAGTYTVTGSASGFIDASKSITISALETLTETLEFGSTNFTVFGNDSFTNESISDFNVTITNEFFDSTINTDTGKVSFSLVNGTYNVSIFASGYSIQTINITIDKVQQNHTFFLFLQNSIFMRLLRESDNSLIDDQTMTIDIDNTDNTFQDTFTTSNGTLFLSGLPPSTYRLEPFSTEFSDRRIFFVTLSEGSHIDIDMRLLNSTEGKEVTFQILDFNTNLPISSAVITATKKVNLSDITVDQATTDDTGIAQLFLKETQQYTLLITHPDYITRIVSLTPTADDTITIRLISGVTYEFTTIFSRFNYLIRPVDSVITSKNITFNLTVSCTTDFPGCLDYFGLQFNSTLINNITASPGGGTAAIFFFVDNRTREWTFNYFVKVPEFDLFEFNFTYVQRREIVTGNQSFVQILLNAEAVFPEWFRPVIAVLVALLVMIILRSRTDMSGTGLAVIGIIVEIFFAIFNWIPRLIMFIIVIVGVIGWLLKESGDT